MMNGQSALTEGRNQTEQQLHLTPTMWNPPLLPLFWTLHHEPLKQ